NEQWNQNGMTVAGGNGNGSATNQLSAPWRVFIEEDNTIIIADSRNHRIIRWKMCDRNGQVVVDGNDLGNRLDQLNWPSDVLIDKETDSLIIFDL
ncbi:unnamed protein product, partial [Rotaria magnacalcarata]